MRSAGSPKSIGTPTWPRASIPGPVEIIVGNDGSTDRTSELARRAIEGLQHARGLVVDLPHAGKSNGLNGALALATGEIVIRLDADTFISDRLGFSAIIPHFSDPEVGGVQGSIHPRQRKGWTRKLRALEIAWGHYFQRPGGHGRPDPGEVIDGLFSARFRRKDLSSPLAAGVPWNDGEDARELSMRIQRFGCYRVRLEFRGARPTRTCPGKLCGAAPPARPMGPGDADGERAALSVPRGQNPRVRPASGCSSGSSPSRGRVAVRSLVYRVPVHWLLLILGVHALVGGVAFLSPPRPRPAGGPSRLLPRPGMER